MKQSVLTERLLSNPVSQTKVLFSSKPIFPLLLSNYSW